jgi:hypothetical protein
MKFAAFVSFKAHLSSDDLSIAACRLLSIAPYCIFAFMCDNVRVHEYWRTFVYGIFPDAAVSLGNCSTTQIPLGSN